MLPGTMCDTGQCEGGEKYEDGLLMSDETLRIREGSIPKQQAPNSHRCQMFSPVQCGNMYAERQKQL